MKITRAAVETAKPWVEEVTEDAIRVTTLDTPSLPINSFDLWLAKHDKSLTPNIMYEGFWESWITAWCINNIKEGQVVLDIGANCGYFTMLFERLTGPFGQVYAYEANPHYAELLKRTRSVNEANFSIMNVALSDTIGEVELHIPSDLTGSASIVSDWKDDDRYNDWSITVPTTTLNAEQESGRFWAPNIVKMDIEGAEELVFHGGSDVFDNDHAPLILMEYTPGAYSDGFNEELFKYGEVTSITETGEEAPVALDFLNNLTDWAMLIIRRHR